MMTSKNFKFSTDSAYLLVVLKFYQLIAD